ncbi:TniQ family protein [Actinoallomurus purpureus]|uniref:TniQ family protein n=1 Tax=Actinoallomurus purpureus TaxID=478114 RepID=UPI00209387A4|nr:TniQ family protein [Actinoallomurus purpureus]MCO6004034.1 TniQ family protein [Actinoallomurus purpureus]
MEVFPARPRRRLPRVLPPILDETLDSYASRLAHANRLHNDDLHAHLTGSKNPAAPIQARALATVTGYPLDSLHYAMLELCGPTDLVAMSITGRPIPGGLRRPACYQCTPPASPRTDELRIGEHAWRWSRHEDLLCRRHQRWIGDALSPDTAQPSLTKQPEILAANRRHRRLIKHHGRDQVRLALGSAHLICTEWHSRGGQFARDYHRLMATFHRHGDIYYRDGPTAEASRYPQIIALTRLLASPTWRSRALHDNLNVEPPTEPFSPLEDLDRMPERARRYYAGVLQDGPQLDIFLAELRRTVAPRYRWDPYAYHRYYDPLVRWIKDELKPDPGSPLPPEAYEPGWIRRLASDLMRHPRPDRLIESEAPR